MKTNEFNRRILVFEKNLNTFALTLTKNKEDAKDLVQETFFKAIQNQEKYTSDKNMKAWLFTILRNTYLNYITKLSSKNTIKDNSNMEYILDYNLYVVDSSDVKVNVANIYDTIEKLRDELKIPFLLFLQGFKYKEISAQINLPIGTTKSRIFLARRTLIKELQDFV